MKRAGLKPDLVEAKLREFNGNMAAVGRHFGCSRFAVWHFCNKREELRKVAHDIREAMKDDAEDALQQAVKKGEAWAVCFYLKCQAKDRGYIEKSELDVRGIDEAIERQLARLGARGQAGDAPQPDGQAVPDTGHGG